MNNIKKRIKPFSPVIIHPNTPDGKCKYGLWVFWYNKTIELADRRPMSVVKGVVQLDNEEVAVIELHRLEFIF